MQARLQILTQSTVKGALVSCKVEQGVVGFKGRVEDENTRVEAIRPANIGSSGEVRTLKKLIYIVQHQCVGIEKDTFLKACQCPCMQLGKGDTQLGSLEKLQADGIAAIKLLHLHHLVIHVKQLRPSTHHPHETAAQKARW